MTKPCTLPKPDECRCEELYGEISPCVCPFELPEALAERIIKYLQGVGEAHVGMIADSPVYAEARALFEELTHDR